MARDATITFPSEHALQLALTSELVPVKVQAAPAGFRRLEEGAVEVAPERGLSKRQLAGLEQAGAVVGDGGTARRRGLRRASCWAEILRPRRTPEHELQAATVLFALPRAEAALALAGELLRLGCDRQELCFIAAEEAETAALIKAVKPPYYSLARALEHEAVGAVGAVGADGADGAGLRAFEPAPPGQERVWTEVCHEHPLAAQLQPAKGELLLIRGDGRWWRLEPGDWIDLYQLIEVTLPGEGRPRQHEPSAPAHRLRVSLQLRSLAREAPASLWVLRGEEAVSVVDRLVQQLPEREIGRLLYAVAGPPERPLVVLRARAGRGDPPVLELPAEAYAPWLEVGHLFLPDDAILEPPLRRETLARLLAPSPDAVTWLAPRAGEGVETRGGGFAVERLAESAFAPLEEWVEYVVHARAEELEPWVRATTFDFEAFESIGLEWAERPPEPAAHQKEPARKRRRRAGAADDDGPPLEAPARAARTPAQEEEELYLTEVVETGPSSADEAALAALEQRFVELEAPADAPERNALWGELARLYTRLGRRRDAALSHTRALWEAASAEAPALAASWAASEAALLGGPRAGRTPEQVLRRLTGRDDPEPADVSALCAALVTLELQGAAPAGEQLQQLQLWLNAHDGELDCRSSWLARLALSRLVGSDTLQLVRTRDRILARLSRGLSIERDVPTFLRFCGGVGGDGAGGDGGGGAGAPNVEALAQQLELLLQRYHKTKRKRSAVEAPEELTRSYVQICFAYGLARLGRSERARALLADAGGRLDTSDPIHDFLLQAYTARVQQALAGQPAETALPAKVGGMLNEMERFTRYKVDRLRQASQILEPQEHLDPVLAFQQDKADPRGEEFAPMRGMTDPEQLSRAVAEVMDQALAPDAPLEERDRLFDGVMDFFPLLPESESVPHLQALVASVEPVAPPRRCLLLEEALMLAGFFTREELVRELVARLKDLIAELGSEHAAEVAKTLGQCLRSLRRVGLLEEAAELLAAVADSARGEGTAALVARLHLAAGMADIGRMDQAEPLLLEGKQALGGKSLLLVDRLEITRALAFALGHAPQAVAVAEIAALAGQLPQISDSFNTNSHFCLSVIQFMESLILGLASEQLVLGQLGRRWLDEDEYLVRRRIHRDLARLAEGA